MRGYIKRMAVVGVLAIALVVPLAAVASAEEAIVPNHAIVGSVDLYGMTLTEARAAIAQEPSVTLLPPLKVKAAGRYFSVEASRCLVLDVEKMLSRACSPSV
jgi:hypothetical protein